MVILFVFRCCVFLLIFSELALFLSRRPRSTTTFVLLTYPFLNRGSGVRPAHLDRGRRKFGTTSCMPQNTAPTLF